MKQKMVSVAVFKILCKIIMGFYFSMLASFVLVLGPRISNVLECFYVMILSLICTLCLLSLYTGLSIQLYHPKAHIQIG